MQVSGEGWGLKGWFGVFEVRFCEVIVNSSSTCSRKSTDNKMLAVASVSSSYVHHLFELTSNLTLKLKMLHC